MKVFSTSDSPSWTNVSNIREEINNIEEIINSYDNFPVNLGFCFRCLENGSGWKSKARYTSDDNYIGFDIVTYEADYLDIKKDMDAQRKVIGAEFYEFFPKTMKKYEKKFRILKEINPTFLPKIEQWLKDNNWID